MAIFYIPPNMQGEVTIEENTGDFNWVPINNSDALWPLSGGSWGRIMIADYNHDCYLDIMIQGEWMKATSLSVKTFQPLLANITLLNVKTLLIE